MNTRPPAQTPTRTLSWIRWLAWGGLILIGGNVLTVLLGFCQSVAKDGLHSRKLPFLVFLVIFVVGFFCLKAATHPIRGRGDERRAWKERFPAQAAQDFKRFLQVVGDELGLRKERWCRLRPDDRVAALTQEWLCGDGLDIIELFMAIEQEYGLELPESFHETDRTLGDLFAHVAQHASKGPGPSQSGKRDTS